MSLKDIFNEKTVFSLEVFPPHTAEGTDKLVNSLTGIKSIKPDFISITLGAGGSKNNASLELADKIQNKVGIPTVAHIPGLYRSKADVIDFLNQLRFHGIKNVLALRGDRIPDQEPAGDFKYASELAEFIRQQGDFDISGACYPQKHPESINFVDDTLHLKEKIDHGASHLITQMLFDNQAFYDFRERLQLAQIDVPVEVGIMPCTNRNQIKRITELSGIPMPRKFVAIMDRYRNNPEAMRDAGIAYAIDQIVDLVSNNVDGIHLYTMNNAANAQRIWDATHTLFAETSNRTAERV
ncbi:methylenetetrahydrofolate reductase [NAD(P)H] [Fructilactobacillus frigidiflavus]|uniref:methylenetetrahydrofolate reductase [NAD(P)H] n=1 Tax=Fructilactobacillus frigidiflavus TaxID=3242688 RepID=UPI003756695E